ncbi:iron-uptake system permease protein FeuB [Clostridiales bacterium]|nr:iron-uptake system permease protein FeuB [Clostridiales bacterium]
MKDLIYDERNKIEMVFMAACLFSLIVSAIMGICLGSVRIPASQLFEALISGSETVNGRIIIFARVPRVLASLLCGGALAVSGVIIQAVLENPLAAPSTIGVNSGAGFFAVLAMALFPENIAAVPAMAFMGAVVTTLAIYIIAVKNGASKITLVLAGVALSNLLNAGINTITTFFPDSLGGITAFKIGGVMGMTLGKLYPACLYIAVGVAVALAFSRELDILSLGDKTARGLGINVKIIRLILLLAASLLAGAAVSFAGLLSFVGLIVPHMAKFFIKSGSFRLIMASCVLGAAFVTFCDTVSRVAFAPYEIQLGIIISYIGAPFFIYLIMKKRGGRHGDRT